MKVSEEAFNKLKVKEIIKLGRDSEESKIPPIFAHPSQRNSVLTFSKKLKKDGGIGIDKSVPKGYRETYKKF